MQANGIREDQVTQVRGFADQRLRKTADALDPSNRRISLIVQYIVKKPQPEESKPANAEGSESRGGEHGDVAKDSTKAAEANPPAKSHDE